eukprot:7033277-Alexandrium_andersonii.AAC.1
MQIRVPEARHEARRLARLALKFVGSGTAPGTDACRFRAAARTAVWPVGVCVYRGHLLPRAGFA